MGANKAQMKTGPVRPRSKYELLKNYLRKRLPSNGIPINSNQNQLRAPLPTTITFLLGDDDINQSTTDQFIVISDRYLEQ